MDVDVFIRIFMLLPTQHYFEYHQGGGGVTASIQGTSVINHRQIVLTQKRLKMTSVYLSILIYFVAIVTHIEDAQF